MTVPHLTPREQDILRAYVRHGYRQAIADELGLSDSTVRGHITRILAAMNCVALGQAAVLFDRENRESWPAVERRVGERRRAESANETE